MRKISIAVFMALIVFVSICSAGEVTEGYTLGAPGCFEYMMTPDKVLIVNTAVQLWLEKDIGMASDKATVERLCTAEGKALYSRIMKLGPVASVRITPRTFAVTVHPFPPNAWDTLLPQVVKEIRETLACKK